MSNHSYISLNYVPHTSASKADPAISVQSKAPDKEGNPLALEWVLFSELIKSYIGDFDAEIAALVKRIESLETDTLIPEMVLLDRVPDILTEGLHELEIRTYVDD